MSMARTYLFVVLASGALSTPAFAECDAKALEKQLADASPVSVPPIYLKLAACNADAARAVADMAVPKILPGEGNDAIVAALSVGAIAPVQKWMGTIEPDRRGTVIYFLGGKCAEEPKVADFFIDSRKNESERFWKERWYRGLTDCRTKAVQEMLVDALANDVGGTRAADRAQKFGLLEVYARNLGTAAIPRLEALAEEVNDPKELRLVVALFADAAGVGNASGVDKTAANAAIKTIEKMGPKLPPESVEQARDTLRALGADDLARSFVKYRWPDRLQDGTYTYMAAATQIATCKNGKKQGQLHVGRLTEPAATWPAELETTLEATLTRAWKLDLAKKCKGTGEIAVTMTPEPVSGVPADWVEAQQEAFAADTAGFEKTEEIEERTAQF